MKRFIYLILIVLVVGSSLLGCSSEENEFNQNIEQSRQLSLNEYVGGNLIVSLKGPSDFSVKDSNNITTSQIDTIEAEGFKVTSSLLDFQNDNAVKSLSGDFKAKLIEDMGFVYLVKYSSDFKSIDEAKQSLKSALENKGLKVRYIEANYKVSAIEPLQGIDNKLNDQQKWHYEMIKAPKAWNLTSGNKDVKVAILDTGIDSDHKNLADYVDKDLAKDFSGDSLGDEFGHGTHVSGTVASYGQVSGVMQEGSLIQVKVLGDSGSGSLYDVTQGIVYAASINADVINMSLGGGGYNQTMDEATKNAYNNGTVVVAASGNDSSSTISYPARYPNVIAVGAVDSNHDRAYFSNYGDGLELMAPGVDIYSTYPDDLYKSWQGTSMATPHVAGVVGLMKAANSEITTKEVRNILRDTTQKVGESNQYGFGIINAYQAVQAAGDFNSYKSNYEQVYFRGTSNNWGRKDMELVADYTWQTTVQIIGDDRFKFDIYGDWSLNFGDSDQDGCVDKNGSDINIHNAGTYQIKFNDNTKEYTINRKDLKGSATILYTINKGSLDEVLSAKISLKKDGENYGEYAIGNNSNQIPRTIIKELPIGDYKATLNLTKNGYLYTGTTTFSITNDAQSVEKTMEINKKEITGYQSNYEQVYLRGTFNSWNIDKMKLVADYTWKKKVQITGDDRFKFDIYGDWSLNFGDNNQDGYLEQSGDDIYINQQGTYVITFNDQTKQYKIDLEESGYKAKVNLNLEEGLELDILGDKVTLYEYYHSADKTVITTTTVKKDSVGNYYVEFSGLERDAYYMSVYRKSPDYQTTYEVKTSFNNAKEEDIEEDATIKQTDNTREIFVNTEVDNVDELVIYGTKAKVYFNGQYQTELDIREVSATPMPPFGGVLFDGALGDYEIRVDVIGNDGNRYVGVVNFKVDSYDRFVYEADLNLQQKSRYQSNYEQLYFRGTPNEWGTKKLELIADYTWETTVEITGDDRFKFDVYGDWSLNFGDNNQDGYVEQDGSNIKIYDAGTYKIRFNDNTKQYFIIEL